MGIPKLKGTYSQRVDLVERYLRDEISMNAAAKEAQIGPTGIRHWIQLYEMEGPEGLKNKKKLQRYPREVKLQAVWDYLDGCGSLEVITKKYGIRSINSLQEWVKTYTTYGDFSPERKEKEIMSQTRKTTQEEREQIVRDCLDNGKDYQGMAVKYQVSYQNVHNWVQKYEKMGYAGLEDRRGKRKGSLPSRTSEEALRDQIAQLQRHNDYLRIENDALKKLKELERRRRWDKSDR